jgi:hypothetical protein
VGSLACTSGAAAVTVAVLFAVITSAGTFSVAGLLTGTGFDIGVVPIFFNELGPKGVPDAVVTGFVTVVGFTTAATVLGFAVAPAHRFKTEVVVAAVVAAVAVAAADAAACMFLSFHAGIAAPSGLAVGVGTVAGTEGTNCRGTAGEGLGFSNLLPELIGLGTVESWGFSTAPKGDDFTAGFVTTGELVAAGDGAATRAGTGSTGT